MQQQFAFEAIGTHWQIDFTAGRDIDNTGLQRTIYHEIERFDSIFSRFRHDSLISKISRKTGSFRFPDFAKDIFMLYEKLYQITDGAFSLLIGQIMEDAGYDAGYSLNPRKIRPSQEWYKTLSYQHPVLTTSEKTVLDFGAAGKGLLIDRVANIFRTYNLKTFCIDAGGDICVADEHGHAMRIGLENPMNAKQVIGVVSISNGNIAGSAGNRRAWNTYHHIINPKTKKSPTHILATWVIADTTMLADALATCLFLCEPEILLGHYDFEYVILHENFTLQHSPNFPAEFFCT